MGFEPTGARRGPPRSAPSRTPPPATRAGRGRRSRSGGETGRASAHLELDEGLLRVPLAFERLRLVHLDAVALEKPSRRDVATATALGRLPQLVGRLGGLAPRPETDLAPAR